MEMMGIVSWRFIFFKLNGICFARVRFTFSWFCCRWKKTKWHMNQLHANLMFFCLRITKAHSNMGWMCAKMPLVERKMRAMRRTIFSSVFTTIIRNSLLPKNDLKLMNSSAIQPIFVTFHLDIHANFVINKIKFLI